MAAWPDYVAWTGLVSGITESRVTSILARGGIIDQRGSALLFGGVSFLALIALVVWMFCAWSWWLPIVCFVGASLIVGAAVRRSNLAIFVFLQRVFSVITIAAAVALWVNGTE